MYRLIIHTAIVLVCCLNTIHAQTVDVSSLKNFEVINRHISVYDSANKKILHLDAAEGNGIAWINQSNFTTGVIEFDVKGKDVVQQSFVGIAFHGMNDSSYDAIYFRPFNFQSADPVRKVHAVQYISMPKYDWYYLREKFPDKYENALSKTVEPKAWFHVKLVVTDASITAFVNNDDKPSLTVKPLNNYKSGKIGFWVGNNADGDFANLTLKKDE